MPTMGESSSASETPFLEEVRATLLVYGATVSEMRNIPTRLPLNFSIAVVPLKTLALLRFRESADNSIWGFMTAQRTKWVMWSELPLMSIKQTEFLNLCGLIPRVSGYGNP